jgi:hypothetical protein
VERSRPRRRRLLTRDEDARVLRDLELASDELNLGVGIGEAGTETELNALDLLRDGREDALLESVELVEASPSADLAETDEDAAHRLEVERLVAAKHEDEATELDSQRLDRFGFACEVERSARCPAERSAKGDSPVPAGPNGEPPRRE